MVRVPLPARYQGGATDLLKPRVAKSRLGDLDDPKFRIGKVTLDFILSLLKKVATAPFALLGHLMGGGSGDELGHMDFEPGAGTLPPAQLESLGKLSEALGQRPQLLEVRGRSDPALDAAALRSAKVAKRAGERIASDPKKYGGGIGQPRLGRDLYVERFAKKGFAESRPNRCRRAIRATRPGRRRWSWTRHG